MERWMPVRVWAGTLRCQDCGRRTRWWSRWPEAPQAIALCPAHIRRRFRALLRALERQSGTCTTRIREPNLTPLRGCPAFKAVLSSPASGTESLTVWLPVWSEDCADKGIQPEVRTS